MLGNLPSFLWGEVVSTTIYTLNRCPTKVVQSKNPFEAWSRRKPNISHLRMFSCEAFSYIIFDKRKKLDKKSKKYIFVGYDNQHRGYKLYSPSFKGVFVPRDVKFNELLEESTSNEDVDDSNNLSVAPNWLDIDASKSPQEQNSSTQRVTRSMTLNKYLFAKIENNNEPSYFKNILSMSVGWKT